MKGVYKIENLITHKIYVGSSVDMPSRRNDHFSALRRGVHVNRVLQNSFTKHGEINFKFSIIETCDNLVEREQYYIDTLKPEYNIFKTAYSVRGENHPMFGKTHSEATKQKIKEARSFQKISHSQETKNKISAAGKLRKMPVGHLQKMINARGGKAWNDGIKTNISPVNKIKFSHTKLSKIILLYSEGLSVEKLRLKYKVSWDTIKRILLENDQTVRNISQQKNFSGRKL